MTVDFNDYFWGEKNNGFDVLYHNMKFGLVASKELADFFREKSNVEEQNSKMMSKLAHKASTGTLNSTFAPVWTILRTSAEKLSTLHLQMVQKLTELVKDVAKYADELHKKHKTVKEEESQTLECVQAMQASTASVQKARDLYNTKLQELEKLRKDNASQKDIDKIESKLRKLQEEYKALLDKHNPIKTEFERRMTQTCKRFQEIEEVHLRQMKEFLSTFLEMLQNNHDMVGQVHSDFKRQFNDMTVDKLLEQFVLNKYTGLERPEVPELEFIPLSKQQQQSISATRLNQPVTGTSNSNSASGSVCLDQRGNNEAGSVASGLGGVGGSDSLFNADDSILGITTSPRPNSPELANVPAPATTSAPSTVTPATTTPVPAPATSVKSNFRNWFSSSIPSKPTANTPNETNVAQAAVANTGGNFGMDSHGTPHTGTTATIMINSLKSELQSLQDNNNQGSFMSSALTKLPEQTANNPITTTNTTNSISKSTTTSTTTTSSATSVTMTQSQSRIYKVLLNALTKSLRDQNNIGILPNSISGSVRVDQRGSNDFNSLASGNGSQSLVSNQPMATTNTATTATTTIVSMSVKDNIRSWMSSYRPSKSTLNKPVEEDAQAAVIGTDGNMDADDLATCTSSTATFTIHSFRSNLLSVKDNCIQGSFVSTAFAKLPEEVSDCSATTINTTNSAVGTMNENSLATTAQSQSHGLKELLNAMTKNMCEQSSIGSVPISNSINLDQCGKNEICSESKIIHRDRGGACMGNSNAAKPTLASDASLNTDLTKFINMPAPASVTPVTASVQINFPNLLSSNNSSEPPSHPPIQRPNTVAAITSGRYFHDIPVTDSTADVLTFLTSTLELLQNTDIQDSVMSSAPTKLPQQTTTNSVSTGNSINSTPPASKKSSGAKPTKNHGQQSHDQQQRCTSPTSVMATTSTTTTTTNTTTASRKFTEQFSTSLSERSNHHPHQHSHSTTHHTSTSTTSSSNATNSRRTTSLLNIFTSNSQVSGILRSRRDKTKTKKLKKKKDGDSAENIQEERMTSVERGNDSYNYDDHNKTMPLNSSGNNAGGVEANRRRVGGLTTTAANADSSGGSVAGVGASGAIALAAAGGGSGAGMTTATGVANAAAAGAGNGTVSVGAAAGSGAAYGANEVDEDGYSMQPPKEIAWEENHDNVASFYSDSDSDSETEKPERRIHVKIKPLNNGQAPMSASVDELRATVENISLSPTGHSQQLQQSRIPSRQQSPEISNASTPTASVHPYAPLQSPTLSMSNNSRYADLGDIFSELGDMSASAPASATLARYPTRQIPTPTSSNSIAIPRPPSRRSEMAGGGASSIGAAGSTTAAALAAARGRISPSPMNRADSIGSLEFRTAIGGIGSSRGPSPLTIGISDTIPLAVAFHEIIHAYFRGSDESRCQVKISGDMMLSFPAGIAGLLANNPNPAKLGFRIKNMQNLENLVPNSKLVQIDRNQSSAFSTMLEFNMPALTALLRRQNEHNPTASYFNVDILKYQVRCKPGASSCPFQLVCYWKCEPTFTALKIDYKYNNHAMANASPLLNVTLAVPVNGSVRNVQSKPHSAWLGESSRLVWNFTDISQNSQDGGVGTLRARLELNEGPSVPAILSTQFNCEGTTLSGIEFELQGSGYRLSLVKRRFVSGKYVCEGDGIRSGATPTPPSVGSSSPFSAKSN